MLEHSKLGQIGHYKSNIWFFMKNRWAIRYMIAMSQYIEPMNQYIMEIF